MDLGTYKSLTCTKNYILMSSNNLNEFEGGWRYHDSYLPSQPWKNNKDPQD
jgi:hypothetical protein